MVSACSKVPALKHGGLDRDLVDQGVRRESLPSLAVQLLAHCLSLVAQPQGERTERASASPRYSHGTPARSTPQTNIPACFVLCVGWCNLTLSVGKNRRETYGGKNAGGKNEAEPPAAAKRAMVSGFRHTAATRPPHGRHTAATQPQPSHRPTSAAAICMTWCCVMLCARPSRHSRVAAAGSSSTRTTTSTWCTSPMMAPSNSTANLCWPHSLPFPVENRGLHHL